VSCHAHLLRLQPPSKLLIVQLRLLIFLQALLAALLIVCCCCLAGVEVRTVRAATSGHSSSRRVLGSISVSCNMHVKRLMLLKACAAEADAVDQEAALI
jgi:ABC-type Mn2+/Zn2+ transport system permease subunit